MTKFQEQYEAYRRIARQFGLRDGLADIWRLSLHLSDGQPLPDEFFLDRPDTVDGPLKEYVYPWDLDTLARDLVLHGRGNGLRHLGAWSDLAAFLNHTRKMDETALSPDDNGNAPDIMLEMHRIAQRQFPWQGKRGVEPIIRTYKIYSEPSVEAVVLRELGMSTRQYLLLGMTLGGQFRQRPENSIEVNYEALGIPLDAQVAFFDRITTTGPQLKAELAARPVESRDWLYGWNPLEARPLLVINPWRPGVAQCPIPRHLLLRTSVGIYYDLVGKRGFENPFGDSFQKYVGDVIAVTCRPPRFSAHEEASYKIGSNKKHGVDWILSDGSGHLFIETKTKRFTLNARIKFDTAALDRDLQHFADAIVQNYKNIDDAKQGKTSWADDGLPVYPVIITLEDLYIFSPRVDDMLRAHVTAGLEANGLSADLPTTMPYTLMSVAEFEIISQVIAQVGIAAFMTPKTAPDMQAWSVLPFATSGFSGELKHVGMLFEEEMGRLMPKSADELILPGR